MNPHRPALRYFGGKWRIAPWIISFFPPHHCYADVAGGGGSVTWLKPPSRLEYYNDKDREVFNFFQVLREQDGELRRSLELTPFSRAELALSYEPSADPVERARRFYVRLWQGRSGARRNRTGWRTQSKPAGNKSAIKDFTNLSNLPAIVERLREVALECDDMMAVLRRYDADTTLFYVDPPYLRSTRKSYERYACEFETEHDHRLLGAVLNELEGMVVLSGLACPLYEEIFEAKGWQRHDRETRNQSRPVTESVWLNPSCAQQQRQMTIAEAICFESADARR